MEDTFGGSWTSFIFVRSLVSYFNFGTGFDRETDMYMPYIDSTVVAW